MMGDGPRIIVDVSDHEDDNEYAVFNDVDTDNDSKPSNTGR